MEFLDREVLQRSLCAHFDEAGEWKFSVIKTRPAPQAMSIIIASSQFSGKRVVIKGYERNSRNEEQFKGLEALFELGIGFVTPRYLDQQGRFFVMDWVDAPLLSNHLGKENHDELIFKSGRWLAQLQSATARKSPPRAGPNLHKLRIKDSTSDVVVKNVSKHLVQRVTGAVFEQVDFVRIHGDFNSGNLFQTPEGLLAFDAQRNAYGSAFQDPARFLLSLATGRQKAAERDRFWPGSADSDRKSFFRGYGAIRGDQVSLFDLIEDWDYARRWRVCRAKYPESAMCQFLEHELEMRGLLNDNKQVSRPGRLVVRQNEVSPSWTSETQSLRDKKSAAGIVSVIARRFSISLRGITPATQLFEVK